MSAQKQWLVIVCLVLGASLALAPAQTTAQDNVVPAAPLAAVTFGAGQIQWQLLQPNEGVSLTVAGPYGEVEQVDYAASSPPTISLRDAHGQPRPDGVYTWELRARPMLSPAVRQELVRARDTGDDTVAPRLRRMGLLPLQPLVQSGHFRILSGQLVAGSGQPEPDAEDQASGGLTATASPGGGLVARAADVVHADDVIVTGSMCIGFDCLTDGTEDFGFDTLKTKENNLRIFFDDTSSTAGFPLNDWRFVANDSSSGGGEYFALEDATNSKTPFKIEGNARTSALYVNSSGRVGVGTATPVLNLHVLSGDTPSLRLDQDTSYGWTAQVWDVAGNESNFFIRDTTGGSKLPFRIQPGAPTNTVTLKSDGKVGLGTWSPGYTLEVEKTAEDAVIATDRTDGATGKLASTTDGVAIGAVTNHPLNLVTNDTARVTVSAAGNVGIGTSLPSAKFTLAAGNMLMDNNRYLQFKQSGGTPASIFWLDTSNDVNFASPTGRYFNLREGPTIRMTIYQGRVGMGVVTPTHPLQMASGAHVTASGVWTNASSRAYKQDIAELPADAAAQAFSQLNPVTFAYRADPSERHVGFIAEDVPGLVATGDRAGLSPMDIVAVLTKVLQQQQQTIADQQAALAQLQARVAQLESR